MRVHHPQPVALTGACVPLVDGRPGIMKTIRVMRALVRQGRVDPFIVESARNIILNCPYKDKLSEINALFMFVRDCVRYCNDVLDVETLSPAWYTLHTRSGDCDDKAVLLCSLLEAVGVRTHFVVAGYRGPDFEHVYVAAATDDGDLIEMDPTEMMGLGWSAPDPVSKWIEAA